MGACAWSAPSTIRSPLALFSSSSACRPTRPRKLAPATPARSTATTATSNRTLRSRRARSETLRQLRGRRHALPDDQLVFAERRAVRRRDQRERLGRGVPGEHVVIERRRLVPELRPAMLELRLAVVDHDAAVPHLVAHPRRRAHVGSEALEHQVVEADGRRRAVRERKRLRVGEEERRAGVPNWSTAFDRSAEGRIICVLSTNVGRLQGPSRFALPSLRGGRGVLLDGRARRRRRALSPATSPPVSESHSRGCSWWRGVRTGRSADLARSKASQRGLRHVFERLEASPYVHPQRTRPRIRPHGAVGSLGPHARPHLLNREGAHGFLLPRPHCSRLRASVGSFDL